MNDESCCVSEDMLNRVRGEFLEMPGMSLTEAQARRLWNLNASDCQALLTALVDSNFLFKTRDGVFMRLEQARPIRATLTPRRRSAAA